MATSSKMPYVVGGVTGLVVWLGWFFLYVKAKQPALEAIARTEAPIIAEDAAKAYIAARYGLTPEIMRRISARAGFITTITDALRR